MFATSPNDTLEAMRFPSWKRGTDVLLTLAMLPFVLLLAPVLVCWIKLVSPGPCIFRQIRIGRSGRPFTLYKFRTMNLGSEDAIHEAHVMQLIMANRPMNKLDYEDSRVIKGGLMIRMSGIDELPQLINVLRGEMSLVGPRPCIPNEVPLYGEDHRRRFAVHPGLTGLWQVERTKPTTFREMAGLDLEYVERLSPLFDFKILMRTPGALIWQITNAISKGRKAEVGPLAESGSGRF